MRLKLRSTVLQIDFLLVLFAVFGFILGEVRQISLLALSLIAHETAHFAAAKALHIAMPSVRLTPFGGLARIDNPYSISSLRLCGIAIAGPLANLLALTLSAALCHWQLIDAVTASELMQINLLLAAFNLLPALPLDGGRILYALLSLRLPRRNALSVGVWFGRLLALLLVLLALYGLLEYGQFNLSCLFAAVFIFASAYDEHRALDECQVRTLFNSIRPLSRPTLATIIAVESGMSPRSILSSIRPDKVTLFACYDSGRLTKLIDARTLSQNLCDTEKVF